MRELVAAARVGRLATTDAHGRVALVPFCFVLLGSSIYSAVDTKPKSTPDLARLENLRANPPATMLVDHYEEDWRLLWWVRLRGLGRVLDAGEESAQARDALVAKYAQYRANPPPGPVLAIDVREWRGWSA